MITVQFTEVSKIKHTKNRALIVVTVHICNSLVKSTFCNSVKKTLTRNNLVAGVQNQHRPDRSSQILCPLSDQDGNYNHKDFSNIPTWCNAVVI